MNRKEDVFSELTGDAWMQSRRKHALAKIINHDRRLHGWMLMTLLLIMMMVMVEAYITIAHTHCK